jgi:hypothetical protein
MITPEQLKKVAEYVGRDGISKNIDVTFITNDKRVRYTHYPQQYYNPLQNSDQDSEIEVKFKMATDYNELDEKWEAYLLGGAICEQGDTPKEARLKAAIVYVKALDNE